MSWNSKVIWSEGMLLQPQHLQQHDRYLHNTIENRVAGLRPYSWGFTRLVIDEQLLAQGKLALLACAGVLPDGTTFNLPQDDALPAPLDIPEDARDTMVMLALPLRRQGIVGTDPDAGPGNFARHRRVDHRFGRGPSQGPGRRLVDLRTRAGRHQGHLDLLVLSIPASPPFRRPGRKAGAF